DPPGAAAPRPRRPRAGAGRCLDLHDPRVLQPAPEDVSVRGRARPALPRAGRDAGAGALGRGLRRGARRLLPRGTPGAAPAPRDLRRPEPAPDDHRYLRDAALGGPRPRAGAGGGVLAPRAAPSAR